jgi:hypothetical protein
MPRYFFHVHMNQIVELDRLGLELASLPEAVIGAHRARIAIMREDSVDQLWLEIADETGRVVAEIA